MAKCFISGLEIRVSSSFVLDVGAAKRLERELRQKTAALGKMIEMLGTLDKVQMKDNETGCSKTRWERRLLCAVVADGLNAAWKEHKLFIEFNEYKKKRKKRIKAIHSQNTNEGKNSESCLKGKKKKNEISDQNSEKEC